MWYYVPMQLPQLPENGQQMYDSLMQQIETMLTTDSLQSPATVSLPPEQIQRSFSRWIDQLEKYTGDFQNSLSEFESRARNELEGEQKQYDSAYAERLLNNLN